MLDERLEEFVMTKLDRKAPKPNNLEILGQCLIDAGHEIGNSYQYCKDRFDFDNI